MAETIEESRSGNVVERIRTKASELIAQAGRKTVSAVAAGGLVLTAVGCNPIYQRETKPTNEIVVLGDSTVQRITPYLIAALKSHNMDPVLVYGVQGTQLEGGTARYAPDGMGLLNTPSVQSAIKAVGKGKVYLDYGNNPLLDHVNAGQFVQAEVDAVKKVASINKDATVIMPLIANGQQHFFQEFTYRNWLTAISSTSNTAGFNTINLESALCGGDALDISSPCELLGHDVESGVHVAGVADSTAYANAEATALSASFQATTLMPQYR